MHHWISSTARYPRPASVEWAPPREELDNPAGHGSPRRERRVPRSGAPRLQAGTHPWYSHGIRRGSARGGVQEHVSPQPRGPKWPPARHQARVRASHRWFPRKMAQRADRACRRSRRPWKRHRSSRLRPRIHCPGYTTPRVRDHSRRHARWGCRVPSVDRRDARMPRRSHWLDPPALLRGFPRELAAWGPPDRSRSLQGQKDHRSSTPRRTSVSEDRPPGTHAGLRACCGWCERRRADCREGRARLPRARPGSSDDRLQRWPPGSGRAGTRRESPRGNGLRPRSAPERRDQTRDRRADHSGRSRTRCLRPGARPRR